MKCLQECPCVNRGEECDSRCEAPRDDIPHHHRCAKDHTWWTKGGPETRVERSTRLYAHCMQRVDEITALFELLSAIESRPGDPPPIARSVQQSASVLLAIAMKQLVGIEGELRETTVDDPDKLREEFRRRE